MIFFERCDLTPDHVHVQRTTARMGDDSCDCSWILDVGTCQEINGYLQIKSIDTESFVVVSNSNVQSLFDQ